jgi:hypothetical protein
MGIKNKTQYLMLILNPVEKFEKTHMKKLITNEATEKLGF